MSSCPYPSLTKVRLEATSWIRYQVHKSTTSRLLLAQDIWQKIRIIFLHLELISMKRALTEWYWYIKLKNLVKLKINTKYNAIYHYFRCREIFSIIGLTSRPSLLLLVDVILQMFEETLHTYMTYRKNCFLLVDIK